MDTTTVSADRIAELLPVFVAGGDPSDDTIRSYEIGIDYWLAHCKNHNLDPLTVTEIDAQLYLRWMAKAKYSRATVALRIAAVKAFYMVAGKLNLVDKNPFAAIKPKQPTTNDADFVYFNPAEIARLCEAAKTERHEPTKLRNLSIIMLMATEGLRTVEITRMNDKDIDFKANRIFVHGKGSDAYIYPCADTMAILQNYIACRPTPVEDTDGKPTFITFSRGQYEHMRITRNGIRWAVNQLLIATQQKKKGVSCHTLRHSCGTNLYQETKDLRLVQETLRQKNPTVTARYTHVKGRIDNRATSCLSPFGGNYNGN